ncbi:unnamed protein product [Ectocarpus sp. CCAP 1310/34]|nr:unnamed protein product [Ectocarpus sp. CCAP 1310/34]
MTRESSLERPEGWIILPSERWRKQTNDKGLAYYLDLETGETHWFPPCEQCYKREGEKICMDCEEQVYCGRCWTMAHKEEDMAGHVWKGADSGKMPCAASVTLEFTGVDTARTTKSRRTPSPRKAGRTDNEPTYYFNASTGESTFDKPQDLMLPEELVEHLRFLKYKETSEKKPHVMHADMKADHGTGGGLSLSGLKFGGGDKKSKKKAAAEDPRTREQEEGYKKSLLLSRKDKKDMGFEVKLKKETVLDS